MKARVGFSAFALAMAGLAAPVALAQTTAAGTQLYLGGTFGQSVWRPGCPAARSCEDTDRALRAFAGYQINRNLAAEVGFSNLGKVTGIDPSGRDLSVKGNAWDASLVAGLPLGTTLSLYGRLGAFRGNAEGGGTVFTGSKETNYGATYGFGAQPDVTGNLALRGEFQRFAGIGGSTLPDSDVDVISFGALWRLR